ncbi:MAG: DUF2971 domain-containing protein [Pseudomonadota bacterium]
MTRYQLQFSREDFAAIFSDDVELTDVRYSQSSIYKYFYFPDLAALRAFFEHPSIKFAHKDDLNDPFELSRRWQKFGCPFTDAIFDKYVRKRVEAGLNDIGVITRKFREYAKRQGMSLSRQQARRWLASREGKERIAVEQKVASEQVSMLASTFPKLFREHEGKFIDSFAMATGILSLTENPCSADMWREYANEGRGFVLEFDADHKFFSHTTDDGITRKLLRKVFYRDDRIEDFWKNPHYLFLVKETKWAFESEWRMIKSLDQCRKTVLTNGRSIYLLDAPAGLIKSVSFGSKFPTAQISESVKLLKNYDPNIEVRNFQLST